VLLNNTNSNLPPDTVLLIDTQGKVQYAGYSTTATATGIEVEITNITYNL